MMTQQRVRALNDTPVRRRARYVLYWTQMNRRADSNHGLEFAAEQANQLGLPLLVYEGVTCSYPHANDRFHTFLLEGVPETRRRLEARGIGYRFHLRRTRRDPNDTLYRLAERAAMLVTDDYPVFVAAQHNATIPAKIGIPYYAVDSSCVVPMALFGKKEYGAYTLRPKITRLLREHMRPVDRVELRHPWGEPSECEVTEANVADLVGESEIDHLVKPSISFAGGRLAAEKHLRHFLDENLKRYAGERNEPSAHATSNLSPWLHFGHVSALEVALAADNAPEAAEFLEELIVRRELAFNHARFAPDPGALEALPNWARETLNKHTHDRRNPLYTCDQFEIAATHDELWNACQHEMLLRGKIHGYYRMYWGKKILEWSATPAEAAATMVRLHDRYALDGRDPNTYTNILWCLGLHDRPWGERDVFGMVRYMSLDGMRRKTNVDAYLREIGHIRLTGVDPFRLQ